MKPRLVPPCSDGGTARQTGRAEKIAKDALDDERETKRQQQPIEMIEVLQALKEKTLDDHADDADNDRCDDDRPPVAEPEVLQQKERRERAQHVLGAVREIDDVQHAENDREPQAQERIKRAIDQPEQELTEQGLRRDSEDLEHGLHPSSLLFSRGRLCSRPPP